MNPLDNLWMALERAINDFHADSTEMNASADAIATTHRSSNNVEQLQARTT